MAKYLPHAPVVAALSRDAPESPRRWASPRAFDPDEGVIPA